MSFYSFFSTTCWAPGALLQKHTMQPPKQVTTCITQIRSTCLASSVYYLPSESVKVELLSYYEGYVLSEASLPYGLKRNTAVVIIMAKLTKQNPIEQHRPIMRAYKFHAPIVRHRFEKLRKEKLTPQSL